MAKSDLTAATEAATGQTNLTDAKVFNSVLAGMSDPNALPKYRAGDSFTPYGKTFLQEPKKFFDYMDSLATKYAGVFQYMGKAKNPLSFFRRGELPYGGKIETQVFDTIEPKMYRPDLVDGKEDPFAQAFGRVMGHTYTQFHDIETRNTIVDTQDTMVFQNLAQFQNFVNSKVIAMTNGVWLDEFYHDKLALAKSYVDGLISEDPEVPTNIKQLQQKILYWCRALQYFRSDSNAVGFQQATPLDEVVILLPLKVSIDLDINLFANMFNPEVSRNIRVKIVEIDAWPDVWTYDKDHVVTTDDINGNFVDAREYPVGSTIKAGAVATANATDATQKLNGDDIGAMILDKDAFQMWDALPFTLTGIANPAKRYYNVFGNKKTWLMFVQALNSKVIKYKPA